MTAKDSQHMSNFEAQISELFLLLARGPPEIHKHLRENGLMIVSHAYYCYFRPLGVEGGK